jgi:hypothetical protein
MLVAGRSQLIAQNSKGRQGSVGLRIRGIGKSEVGIEKQIQGAGLTAQGLP